LAHYTPDRRFLLEFQSQHDFESMREIIEDLYAQDPFAAGRMLEAVRWEGPTELEEAARRWRGGRLRGLGVPAFEAAISFYARPASRTEPPPGTPALAPVGKPLLDQALEKLSGDDLERAEEALVYAANSALVANRAPLGDADEVREQLVAARATLSLG